MAMTLEEKVRRIKFVTQEKEYPMFTDEDIIWYLNEYNGNMRNTIYNLLCLKADTGAVQITGCTLPSPERYFMRIAQEYRPNNSY